MTALTKRARLLYGDGGAICIPDAIELAAMIPALCDEIEALERDKAQWVEPERLKGVQW